MIDVDELAAPITLFTTLHNRIWHMGSEFRIIRDLAQNMEDYFLERCIDFEKYNDRAIKKAPKYLREVLNRSQSEGTSLILHRYFFHRRIHLSAHMLTHSDHPGTLCNFFRFPFSAGPVPDAA
jgi:hypothetical protein